jgi:hypothetical protein
MLARQSTPRARETKYKAPTSAITGDHTTSFHEGETFHEKTVPWLRCDVADNARGRRRPAAK